MTTATGNVTWRLTDWYGSPYGDHEHPAIPVRTPEQLSAALEEFARKEPRLLRLESSDGLCVGLAVGGPLGVVQVHDAGGRPSLIATTDVPHATEERCFVGDWQPSYYFPRHLLPIRDVIAIAVEVYRTQEPPTWVKWDR